MLVLSQFVSSPAYQHYQAALRLVRYLISTINLGVTYHLDGNKSITGYVDADHASHEIRRTIYSYIFMFAGGPLFWKNGLETRFLYLLANRKFVQYLLLERLLSIYCI